MTYTVYIPDTVRGDAAYTKREFGSIKELARWAMELALEVPAAAPVAEEKVVVPEPTVIEEVLASMSVEAKDIPVLAWNVDTDAWFADDSCGKEFQEPLQRRDWPAVANLFLGEVKSAGFTGGTDVISWEDYEQLLAIVRANPAAVGAALFPDIPVRWELLPAEFAKACVVERKWDAPRVLKHPFLKGIHQVCQFFAEGKRHTSWSDASMDSGGLSWSNHEAAANTLVGAWLQGKSTNDEIREFILKALTVRNFKRGESDIGSAEFLSMIHEILPKVAELPAAFVEWATRGTTHKNCKKALGELGISQVRAAAGQRYKSIVPIPTAKDALVEMYVFNTTVAAVDDSMFDWPAPISGGATTSYTVSPALLECSMRITPQKTATEVIAGLDISNVLVGGKKE